MQRVVDGLLAQLALQAQLAHVGAYCAAEVAGREGVAVLRVLRIYWRLGVGEPALPIAVGAVGAVGGAVGPDKGGLGVNVGDVADGLVDGERNCALQFLWLLARVLFAIDLDEREGQQAEKKKKSRAIHLLRESWMR